jgi:hypothetical protein
MLNDGSSCSGLSHFSTAAMRVNFGAVRGKIDWARSSGVAVRGKIDWARSSGVALRDTGGRDPDGVRLIRLKANRDMNKDVQLAQGFKREWGRGEEIIVSYTPEGDDTSAGAAAQSRTRSDSTGGQRRRAHDDVTDSMATASDDPTSASTSGNAEMEGPSQKRQRKKSKKVLESEGAPRRDASADV